MTGSRLAIPDLGNQPPSVDFIENRLSKYSRAFTDPLVRFDMRSQKFVSRCFDNESKDISRQGPEASVIQINDDANLPVISLAGDSSLVATIDSTSTGAMKYWDEMFPDVLERFRNTPTTKTKGDEFQIRNDTCWHDIYLKLEKARSQYLNQGSKFEQACRRGVNHAKTANTFARMAQDAVPSNPYSTPVLGVVQLILNAMQTAADARTQVLDAFESLPSMFSEIESLLSSFPENDTVRNAAIDFALALLCAVENTIAFFCTSRGKRMVKSIFEGTDYIKGWKESIKSIEHKLIDLRAQSNAANFKASRQHRQRIEKKNDLIHDDVRRSGIKIDMMFNAMFSMMNDYGKIRDDAIERERRIIADLARQRKKNKHLYAEIEILRSRSPSPNALISTQQQDEISTLYFDNKGLQDLLQIEYKDTDLRFINQRKGHLLIDELSRAEQLVNDRKYHAWFMSPQSEKLFILWNQRQPRTHAGISPISVFCASLEPIFNSHSRFICLTWFCGLHSKHGNDEARAMLADLIVQLCQQHDFDFEREYDDTDKTLVREHDPRELFLLLYRLILSLPMEITVIFLVDEAYIYERDGFQDGLNVFNELLQLVTNAAIQSVIKLLFTSTRKVRFLNEAFRQGGLTLHVETAAHQTGGPSQKRMERQMRLDSDQGRTRATVLGSEQEYYERDDF